MSRHIESLRSAQAAGFVTNFSPVPKHLLVRLLSDYPDLPQDYLHFLREVGCGSFGDGGYMIYSAPVAPAEMFAEFTEPDFADLLMFGDDFQGRSGAFLPRNEWKIVEFDSTNRGIVPFSGTFEAFILARLADLL